MNGTALTSNIATPRASALVDTPCPSWCGLDHADPTVNAFLREDHRSLELRVTVPGFAVDHPIAVAAITDAGATAPYIDVWSSVVDARLDAEDARVLAMRYRQLAAHLEHLADQLPG